MIKINIHSLIDVITNSSTEIFVNSHANTIRYFKELIEDLMKCMDVEGKAEDYFEFYIDEESVSTEDDDDYCIKNLVIKSKNNSNLCCNISERIDKIFSVEEVYR